MIFLRFWLIFVWIFLLFWPPGFVFGMKRVREDEMERIRILNTGIWFRTIFILGPSHHVRLSGCAVSQVNTLLYTTWPDKHGRVVLVPCKKWLVQYMLLYTCSLDESLFSSYQKNTDMFNWSPCMLEHTTYLKRKIVNKNLDFYP